MTTDFPLPENLPIPEDDGACRHLPGINVPLISLAATDGTTVSLADIRGWVVIYCYPLTGRPGVPLPEGWDEIPGARGCTPQSCAFRDLYSEFTKLDVKVFGLSTQTSNYQSELRDRLHLPYQLLSDHELKFAEALRLPTFAPAGEALIKRITLVSHEGQIKKVFYPVFPSNTNPEQVLSWLRGNRTN